MKSKSAPSKPAQWGAPRLLLLTTVIAVALAFPEFALVVPVAIVFSLIFLSILALIWALAWSLHGRKSPVAKTAGRNILELVLFVIALLVWGAYSICVVDWTLG